METLPPALVLAFVVIPLLTAIAYWLAPRASKEAEEEPLKSFEGVVVRVIAEGRPQLLLRGDDGVVVEVVLAAATMLIGVTVGQRLRLRGTLREEPNVHGAIYDLRQPPASRSIWLARELVPAPGATRPLRNFWLTLFGLTIGLAILGGMGKLSSSEPPPALFMGMCLLVLLLGTFRGTRALR